MSTGLKAALQCRDAFGIKGDPPKHLLCSFFRPRGKIPHSAAENYDPCCEHSVPLGGGVTPQMFLCSCEEARYEYEKYEVED